MPGYDPASISACTPPWMPGQARHDGFPRPRDLLRHHPNHLQALVRVAPLVVVPGHELDKGAVQGDARIGVEDGSARITAEICGDDLVLGVAQHALERAFGLRLEFRADFLVAGFLDQL